MNPKTVICHTTTLDSAITVTVIFTALPKLIVSNLCQICLYLLMKLFTCIAINKIFEVPILTNVRAGPGNSQMSGPGRVARVAGGSRVADFALGRRAPATLPTLVLHNGRACLLPRPVLRVCSRRAASARRGACEHRFSPRGSVSRLTRSQRERERGREGGIGGKGGRKRESLEESYMRGGMAERECV